MPPKKIEHIIFVYNAAITPLALIADWAKKVVAPESYPCNLCRVTYGTFKMKTEWRQFLQTLPGEKVFLHRDEFHRQYPQLKDVPLPAIFALSENFPVEFVSATEINRQKDLAELTALLSQHFQKFQTTAIKSKIKTK